MKKALIIVLVLSLFATLAVIAPGCGNDGQTAEAKELMEQGDSSYEAASAESHILLDARDEIMAMLQQGDITGIVGESGSELIEEITGHLEVASTYLKDALADYESIMTLDAPDYVEYAGYMVLATEARIEQGDLTFDFIDELVLMLEEAVATGTQPDIMGWSQSETAVKMNQLDTDAKDYEKQAQSVKDEKDL